MLVCADLYDTKTKLHGEEKLAISKEGLTATVLAGQKGVNGGGDIIKPRKKRNGATSHMLKSSSLSAVLIHGVVVVLIAVLLF